MSYADFDMRADITPDRRSQFYEARAKKWGVGSAEHDGVWKSESALQVIAHAKEELIDLANYAEMIWNKLRDMEDRITNSVPPEYTS